MKSKRPRNRRKFAGDWDQIGYLYDKLLYWLYRRENAAKARPYAARLQRLLPRADPRQTAIFGQECRSLVYEAKGDLHQAIKHREREVRLIRCLMEICRNTPEKDVALRDYDYSDLSDRLDLLATLYHDAGRLDKAIAILQESRRLCEAHGISFDGKDLLQEYSQEREVRRSTSVAV